MYLGKNVSEDYKSEICALFNREEKYRAIILDLGEDLTGISFATVSATIIFGEAIWDSNKMREAENVVKVQGMKTSNNILYLFGRFTLDEYIYK